MAEPLRISGLAHSVGLSTSRFAKLFHDSTGTSPGRFLRQLRLDRARALLENTTLSVRQVMTLVGCTDGSHFARDYRRRYSLSPSQSRSRPNPSRTATGRRKPTSSRHGEVDSDDPVPAGPETTRDATHTSGREDEVSRTGKMASTCAHTMTRVLNELTAPYPAFASSAM